MSGGRRAKLSPSLFPFLAVLVCTLGTLILLLALVAQEASDTVAEVTDAKVNQDEADDDPAADQRRSGLLAASVVAMTQDAQARLTHLVSVRDDQTADIERRRDQLAHVQDHTDRLTQQIQQLKDEVKRATSNQAGDDVDAQQLADLQRQIEDEQQSVAHLVSDASRRKPRVVIVPHKGPNGTDRRPVYLECVQDELIIQPENIRITTEQLAAAQTGANPVEAALRVIRRHVTTVYRDPAPPYPLLVVRPDGILTYAAARTAMRDYDDQFGYELVPSEVELAMPQPDTTLRAKVTRAVDAAVARQNRLEIIARQNNFGGHNPFVDSPAGRGGASGPPRRLPELSAAALAREGRTGGFRSLRRDEQNVFTQTAGDAGSLARQYALDRASDRRRSSIDDVAGSARGVGKDGDRQPGRADDSLSDPSREQVARTQQNRFTSAGQSRTGDTDRVGDDGSDSQRDASVAPSPPVGQQSHGGSHPRGTITAASNSPANSQAQNSQAQNSQPQNSQGQPAQQQASPQGSQNRQPAANASPNPYSQAATEDLAQPGRPGWGLPRDVARARGNELLRTIHVQADANWFVMLPARRAFSDQEATTQTFNILGSSATRATLELATSVRDRVQHWGAALPGGRWQPILEVDVSPRGEASYQHLQRVLHGSGIKVTRKK